MNNIMEYKGYNGTVNYSPDDNILFGKVIGIRSFISYEGQSVDELRADFEGAVDEYLEMCAEKGVEHEKTYKGCVNVRFKPLTHKKACIIAEAEHISLNQFIEKSVEEKIASFGM